MRADNLLTREFLMHYPVEAARVLEQVAPDHVAALYEGLPPELIAPVVSFMLPVMLRASLEKMSAHSIANIVSELPASSAARIIRQLGPGIRNEVSGHLSKKLLPQIMRYLEYPSASAGAFLDQHLDLLPDSVTVAEAVRRIEHLNHPVGCDIYIVDEQHHPVGVIELGALFTSNHRANVRDIMHRKIQVVSAHAAVETLISHPGWKNRTRLPVVDRDNRLVGILDYKHVQEASTGEMQTTVSRDPLESLLSLAGLFWLTMAQLVESALSVTRPDSGEGK